MTTKTKPKKETITIPDEEVMEFFRKTSRKAVKEVITHLRSLGKRELWKYNETRIMGELLDMACLGATQCAVFDVFSEVDGKKVKLHIQEAYMPIMDELNSMQLASNLRQHPTLGPFIMVTWPC